MSTARWFRATTVATLILSAAALGAAQPVQATPPAGNVDRDRPLTATRATVEQIYATAAKGNAKLLTLSTGVNAAYTITCVLAVSPPFGGGSPDASIQVDAALQCSDWMDLVSLNVVLWRDLGQVTSRGSALPFSFGLYISAVETPCRSGVYWGVATAFVRRSGFTPPSGLLYVHSVPLPVGCGSTPPPLPPPSAGAVTVINPGNQSTYANEGASLQMRATGGTGSYTWSATGLPDGMHINPSTGLISGSSTHVTTHAVTVTAVSGVGSVGHTTFNWIVRREHCRFC